VATKKEEGKAELTNEILPISATKYYTGISDQKDEVYVRSGARNIESRDKIEDENIKDSTKPEFNKDINKFTGPEEEEEEEVKEHTSEDIENHEKSTENETAKGTEIKVNISGEIETTEENTKHLSFSQNATNSTEDVNKDGEIDESSNIFNKNTTSEYNNVAGKDRVTEFKNEQTLGYHETQSHKSKEYTVDVTRIIDPDIFDDYDSIIYEYREVDQGKVPIREKADDMIHKGIENNDKHPRTLDNILNTLHEEVPNTIIKSEVHTNKETLEPESYVLTEKSGLENKASFAGGEELQKAFENQASPTTDRTDETISTTLTARDKQVTDTSVDVNSKPGTLALDWEDKLLNVMSILFEDENEIDDLYKSDGKRSFVLTDNKKWS
jgi:hypothetical protein